MVISATIIVCSGILFSTTRMNLKYAFTVLLVLNVNSVGSAVLKQETAITAMAKIIDNFFIILKLCDKDNSFLAINKKSRICGIVLFCYFVAPCSTYFFSNSARSSVEPILPWRTFASKASASGVGSVPIRVKIVPLKLST